MFKFMRGKGQHLSAERQKLQRELFAFRKVSRRDAGIVILLWRIDRCFHRVLKAPVHHVTDGNSCQVGNRSDIHSRE